MDRFENLVKGVKGEMKHRKQLREQRDYLANDLKNHMQ